MSKKSKFNITPHKFDTAPHKDNNDSKGPLVANPEKAIELTRTFRDSLKKYLKTIEENNTEQPNPRP